MEIRVAGLVPESYVDGNGIRFAIFMQGCKRHCVGCHNPATHDLNGGRLMDTADIIEAFKRQPLIEGITLTGGEPFLQIEAANELACAAREMGLNVWCYTGYTLEELPPEADKLLANVDVLVDGAFDITKRDIGLQFRGSTNQRIIHLRSDTP